jgi:hypothetical protein
MSCPQFVAATLGVRAAAHLMHLSTRSYAQHVALGDFYEGIERLVDTYAEVYMGLERRQDTWPRVVLPAATGPQQLVADYLELIQEEQKEDHDSEALKNILAALEELAARTLYKLKNLS